MGVRNWRPLFYINSGMAKIEDHQEIEDRHAKILAAVQPLSRNFPSKNLTQIDHSYATRKSSLVLMLIPEWANTFPPYNLCRLAAITKQAGYRTRIMDVNAAGWNQREEWNVDFDPWHGSSFGKWITGEYHKRIHEHLEPLLYEYLDKVVEENPTVVGFTIYDCNLEPVKWFATELRKRLPNVIIIAGGGMFNTSTYIGNIRGSSGYGLAEYFDYMVSGEGEQLILDLMNKIENNPTRPETGQWIVQPVKQRIDLDMLPIPDYEDIDLNLYERPGMVAMELSRGCIAKCTFCDETHYWKYRDRLAGRVMDEIMYLWDKGIRTFWFIDSLVNGNLKEFRAILKGIIAAGLPQEGFQWFGQARVHKNMDREFFKDIADSGGRDCFMFGVESGSNKVLVDMQKGITAQQIEQNFTDAAHWNIWSNVMLIPGFPTERPQEFYETLTLIWRIRNCHLGSVGPGISGCIVSPDTALGMQPKRFGISPAQVGNIWSTRDLMNTKLHRIVRLKTINIMIMHLKNDLNMDYTFRAIKNYELEFLQPDLEKELDYEEIDFMRFFGRSGNDFKDSFFAEHVPLCRFLWKTRGAFKLHINYNPEYDQDEFGDILCSNLHCDFYFEIDKEGNYTSRCEVKFIQDEFTKWKHNFPTKLEPGQPTSRAKEMVLRVYDINKTENETIMDKWAIWEEHSKMDLSFNETRTARGNWS